MTFSILRALHAILADALADIEAVYADAATPDLAPPSPPPPPPTHSRTASRAYASPPPSPGVPPPAAACIPPAPFDFPALDSPYDPASPAEQLTTHPRVVAAINRIVAAAGQMAATVQVPFLTLCDASMGYHLPSCLRLFEAAHIADILRDGPPSGVHVAQIAQETGVDQAKLAHILRLLATHHILREAAPDVFAANRISSLVDSGKPVRALFASPERKYEDTNGIAAFVGLCADELFKSSAYLTEAYLPGASGEIGRDAGNSNTERANAGLGWGSPNTTAGMQNTHVEVLDPTCAPFNYAFGCRGVGYFGWLEGEGWAGTSKTNANSNSGTARANLDVPAPIANPNRFRLERFGKAMAGTGSWEAPGAVLNGFDWAALPRGSVVVDVGGGIGSTSMLLASAYAEPDADTSGGGLRFVIQDRAVVVAMGEKAWRAKCPELLDSGAVQFQVHDFFTPQPVKDAAVFFLRVVLHDWPDAFAHRILLRLRAAAAEHTRLVLADFVLPLACADDFGVAGDAEVQGAETTLAPAPLLANLGKASANAYWMDLTMQATFNGQERTLRETVALALSAGWKVVRVTKAPGSLFGHIVAVPVAVPVPPQRRARAGSGSAFFDVPAAAAMTSGARAEGMAVGEMEMVERASSRCGTPTFGSRMDLPSVAEARARFGGSVVRRPSGNATGSRATPPLKQAAVLTAPPARKKKPSPLSIIPPPSSPSPSLLRPLTSPRPQQQSSPVARRIAQTPLFRPQSQQSSAPSPVPRQAPPPSPMSPRHPLSRRSSYAHLTQAVQLQAQGQTQQQHQPPATLRHAPSSPVLNQHQQHQQRSPPSPVPSRIPAPQLTRRASHAQLQYPQTELRKRSGSIIHPMMRTGGGAGGSGIGGGISMGSLLLNGRASGGALDFGRRRRRDDDDGDSESADDEIASRRGSPVLPARSVLAAAARIERGVPRSPSPDP